MQAKKHVDRFVKVEEQDLKQIKILGEGAFGKVIEVKCPRFGNVVWKSFKGEPNIEEVDHMLKDACHQNIVQFFAVVVYNNICSGYIMAKMDCSLHTRIHKEAQGYKEKMALDWISQAALGLGHLHKKKIIHFDVKPANMLLDINRSVLKICDLGLSKHYDHSTLWGGTPIYQAPESFEFSRPGKEADVWSLGISIWEIYHRRTPYSNKEDGKIPSGRLFKDRPLKWEILKGLTCSKHIEKLLFESKMLGREPSERPSMDTVVNYIEELLDICKDNYIRKEKSLEAEMKKLSLGSQDSPFSTSSSQSTLGKTSLQNSMDAWLTTSSSIGSYNSEETALISSKSQEVFEEIKKLNAKKTKEGAAECKNRVLGIIGVILDAALKFLKVYPGSEEMKKLHQQTEDVKREFVENADQKIEKLPHKKTK